MNGDDSDYDPEWDRAIFDASLPVIRTTYTAEDEDWEARYNEDTTGYVSNSLTTSFTDMDLGPARLKLGDASEWADLDAWLES